jgi:hypothetical protein
MFALSKTATCAALGTFVVIGGLGLSARAEPVQRLGPVGPNDTISATVGSKGFFAWYEPDGGHCGLHVVMFNRDDESGASAVGFRIRLNANEIVNIDSSYDKSVGLQCGDHAETLRIVDPSTWIAAGAAQ